MLFYSSIDQQWSLEVFFISLSTLFASLIHSCVDITLRSVLLLRIALLSLAPLNSNLDFILILFYSYFYHFHRENPSQQFQWFDWCLFLRGDCWGRQSGGDKLVWWSIRTQLGWSEWELLHQILWKMEYDHLCSSYTHSELWLFFLDLFCNLFHLNHNNQIKQDQ